MDSYRAIRHASYILFHLSCKNLPESTVGELGHRFRTGDMQGASSVVSWFMEELRETLSEDAIKKAFILLDKPRPRDAGRQQGLGRTKPAPVVPHAGAGQPQPKGHHHEQLRRKAGSPSGTL